MESSMSRRQFNQKILPDKPPVKYNKLPKRPNNNRRSKSVTKILLRLKSEARDEYCVKEFAAACHVKVGSAKLWFYGRPYGEYAVNCIARYFAPLVMIPLPELRRQLEEARLQAHQETR
jgi:hypothetical protein